MLNKSSCARSVSGFLLGVVAVSVVVFLGCGERGGPGESGEAAADLMEEGRITYLTFCLNCHGETGKGDGPLTELIVVKPSDLTTLSASHEGRFPEAYARSVIRGNEDEIEGHVLREMPVWYTVWTEQAQGGDAKELIDRRLTELVAYLKSIQQ